MIAARYMGTSMLTNALQVRIDEPGVSSPVLSGALLIWSSVHAVPAAGLPAVVPRAIYNC